MECKYTAALKAIAGLGECYVNACDAANRAIEIARETMAAPCGHCVATAALVRAAHEVIGE